ncbi:hypothetical protein PRUPE_1G029300 [Prunus persica]|uniref:Uncharacterized protein n=1 Tax=Prunus persica TaxID=3760 RepID=A0A251QUW2_PRUPE|nr:UPF0481 protein At3g47200 [Prunus persica]ONI26505.1 hypothetical protein PRUPE_1G029300 [Prunus persica]
MENGIQNSTRDHISVVIVDGYIGLQALENTMRAKLCPDSSSWEAKSCIFRVPKVLKRHKPEAYEPDFVSIGPFHHGAGKQFQHMENVKQWYLNNLLSRRNNVSLKNLIDCVVPLEKSAREFYAEPLDHLSQNDLVEMMILDGCFVIELFRKYPSDEEHIDANDPIFNMDCMFQYLCHDLLLLENQLPWFVLQHLYDLTLDPNEPERSLTIVMLTVFTSQKPLYHSCDSYLGYVYEDKHDKNYETLHILDLIRTSIVFPFQDHIKEKERREKERKKKTFCRPKRRRNSNNNKLGTDMDSEFPPATALAQAGVKFRSVSAGSIMNIDFEKGVLRYIGYKRGTFKIPLLSIGELTDPLLRNLIAFEQCYYHHSHEITSYAFLMNKLVASSKDMEFLCEKRIIDNWLNAEDGANYFSRLCNDTVLKRFYYEELCVEVNMHYQIKWYRWLEKFNRDYFANPWSAISLIAAAILLALTVVQTVYAIRSK